MENKNWVELPNSIIYSNLEDYTKLVYAHLEFHLFFLKEQELPSKNSISKILNLNSRTVNKALQELTEKGLLQENNLYCLTKDNQIDETMFSNTEEFTIKEYASKIGGFTKVSLETLSSKDLSSGERMSWIRIKSVKLDKIHIRGIATSVNYSFNNLKRHFKSLKEKGYLSYDVQHNGNRCTDKYIYNLKLFEKSIIDNSQNIIEKIKTTKSKQIKAQVSMEIKAEEETVEDIKTGTETETIKAPVAEAIKAEKKPIIEFDYYYDDDYITTEPIIEFDYYYDDDFESNAIEEEILEFCENFNVVSSVKDNSKATVAEAIKAEKKIDKVDNVVENKEKEMTDEEFDAILAAADDSPITKEETKAPISVEIKAEEEEKNEPVESQNAEAIKAEDMATEKIINSNYTIEQFKNDRNVKVKVMSELDSKIEPIIKHNNDYNEHSKEELCDLLALI